MTEIHYMISDVSRILEVPASVLRYLEYHLSLNIKRTELGHRYYLQEDIDLLRAVKVLRDKGFHLKIIKSILPYIDQVIGFDDDKLNDLRDRLEAALGLSGIEAQERVKAQYGKPVEVDMEEGDFIIKDPSTKQRTRVSTIKEVHTQPPVSDMDKPKINIVSNDVPVQKAENVKKELISEKEKIKDVSKNKKLNKPKDMNKSKTVENIKEEALKQPVSAEVDNKGIEKEKVESRFGQIQSQKIMSFKEEAAATKIEVVKSSKGVKIADIPKNEEDERSQQTTKDIKQKDGRLKDEKLNNIKETNQVPQKKQEERNNLLTLQNQMMERKENETLSKASQDKVTQFRQIMCSIVMDALRQNNHTLTEDINDVVTQSVVKEIDYMMKVREERQEERFRQLDRTIRETQMQRQQAAATKEGKKKRTSKFFKKNKVRI
ncbi:MAG: MerR family transcriptional regulator [Clostridiales bacterium]|nr:MerR family transcriptional regulator [Clostridiales bacterium]